MTKLTLIKWIVSAVLIVAAMGIPMLFMIELGWSLGMTFMMVMGAAYSTALASLLFDE